MVNDYSAYASIRRGIAILGNFRRKMRKISLRTERYRWPDLVLRARGTFSQQIIYFSRPKTPTYLSQLFDVEGSDKGWGLGNIGPPWPAHGYGDVYYEHLRHLSEQEVSILEIGIGTTNVSIPSNMSSSGVPGASLRAMERFFTAASIVGLDVDSDVLFSQGRVSCYLVDQMNPKTFENFWRANPSLEPSVVIDDGLHTYEAARNSFENIFPHLVPGGTYWIEDLRGRDLLIMFDYLRKFGVAVKLFLFARQKSSSLLMVESR